MIGYDVLASILATPQAQPHAAPQFLIDETFNIVVDGDSLYAQWIAARIDHVGGFGTMIESTGAYSGNCSIPGQTWEKMTANAKDVDGLWREGMKNILVVGETTNEIYNFSGDVTKCVNDAKAYLAARRKAHKWDYVVLCGTIPRADKSTPSENVEANKKLMEVDKQLRADESLYDVWVDYREYSPEWFGLRPDGYTAKFMDSLDTCNSYDRKNTDKVHPIKVPRDVFADAIADGIRRLLEKGK